MQLQLLDTTQRLKTTFGNNGAMDNMMKVLYNGGAFKKVADKLPDTKEGFLWTNEYNY